jgi:hypothetical protein
MRTILHLGITFALVLCVADALGQELSTGHANALKTGPSGVTVAHGEQGMRLPAVLTIDHSDLGALARKLRAEHATAPKATTVWDGAVPVAKTTQPNSARLILPEPQHQ